MEYYEYVGFVGCYTMPGEHQCAQFCSILCVNIRLIVNSVQAKPIPLNRLMVESLTIDPKLVRAYLLLALALMGVCPF